MDIQFPGPAVIAGDGGVSFRSIVNGATLPIRITMEALMDIDPPSWNGDPIAQFHLHSATLLDIAHSKIAKGTIENGCVWVYAREV